MLKVSTVTSIGRDRGPFIFKNAGAGLARIHHRLDCQHHAVPQSRAMPASAKVRNLRLFVQPGANPVSHKFANYAEAVSFNVLLHSRTDISDGVAYSRLLDGLVQRRLGHLQQPARLGAQSIHRNGDGGVPIIAVHYHAAVDRDNVACLKHAFV